MRVHFVVYIVDFSFRIFIALQLKVLTAIFEYRINYFSMDKRKVKQQQNIILHDLEDLENEAKKLKNPEVDLDRTFELLQERLLKKLVLLH